jgi:hypothetical protein
MEIRSLNQLVKKALEHYDIQQLNYRETIDTQDVKFNLETTEITFKFQDDTIYNAEYEILGYFDNLTNIWIWGWLLTELSVKHTVLCRELLNYGLKLEPGSNSEEHSLIKTMLVNSRILLEEFTELEVNLAICSYILKDKIKFIFPRKRFIDSSNKKYVTFYYLIK